MCGREVRKEARSSSGCLAVLVRMVRRNVYDGDLEVQLAGLMHH